jgi:hypothetical protein
MNLSSLKKSEGGRWLIRRCYDEKSSAVQKCPMILCGELHEERLYCPFNNAFSVSLYLGFYGHTGWGSGSMLD